MQAVSELLEQHSRQFASSVKDILDPKKLSAGAGAPASSADGPRSAHGSATTKWQVCLLIIICQGMHNKFCRLCMQYCFSLSAPTSQCICVRSASCVPVVCLHVMPALTTTSTPQVMPVVSRNSCMHVACCCASLHCNTDTSSIQQNCYTIYHCLNKQNTACTDNISSGSASFLKTETSFLHLHADSNATTTNPAMIKDSRQLVVLLKAIWKEKHDDTCCRRNCGRS